MRPRTALIAVLALAVAVPVPASAATKKKKKTPPPPPACMLITDAPGDGKSSINSAITSDALDILSGDLATGKSEIVAVMRLKSTAHKDTWHQLGYKWLMGATAAGQRWEFRAGSDGFGVIRHAMVVGGVGVPQATFEAGPNNTFIWRAKRSDVPLLAKPNLVFTDFAANTKAFDFPADATDLSKKLYKDKQTSCVVAK